MSEPQVTPVRRTLVRDPAGTLLLAAAAFLMLSGLVFADLRWLLGFGVIVLVFGLISSWSHAPE